MALDSTGSFSFQKRSLPQAELLRAPPPPPLYQLQGQDCQAALRISCLQRLWVGLGPRLSFAFSGLPPGKIRRILLFCQAQLAFLQEAGPLET